MAPSKVQSKTWRELKQQRKKWKEEKMLKNAIKNEIAKEIPQEVQVSFEVKPTCSIAVPGSILENAQSRELRAYLAGQIARAACIYRVSEVIIFNDMGTTVGIIQCSEKKSKPCCTQFARILQYLECPQYLRKFFFPLHKDLEHAGLINPLDAPHHLRQDEDSTYREGITTDKAVKKGLEGTYVNVGLLQEVLVDKPLQPGIRVTVKLKKSKSSKHGEGIVVSPNTPNDEGGLYWGYSVRIADSLSQVFSKCPFPEGYDLTIGTSDKGVNMKTIKRKEVKGFKHCLIVFGGLQGIEGGLENDEDIHEDDPSVLFDHYVNTCPNQGSRTIRTEEAVLITLAELRRKLFK